MKKLADAFSLEKLRHKLALQKDYKSFKNTYIKTNPEIKDLNTGEFWDQLNTRKHITSAISPMTVHKIRLMSDYIPNKRLKVLNIGCGAGDMENIIFKIQKKKLLIWTGIDISSKSIKARKKEFPNSKYFVGDIRRLIFKSKDFDVIVLMEILEHIKPSEVFKSIVEVKRVLKNNGKLIISVPINEGLSEMVIRGINPNAHVRDYTSEILQTELKLSGFQIVDKKVLYAFPSLYWIKSLLAKYIFTKKWQPNSLIILAQKN